MKTRRIKTAGRRLLVAIKWSAVVAGLAVASVLGFSLGWKSWSADKSTLEASAQRSVALSVKGTEVPASAAAKLSATEVIDVFLDDALGAVRFSGAMGLGKAQAFKLVESLRPSQLPSAFAAAIEEPRTSSRDRVIDFLLDRWARIDPQKAFPACAEAFESDREAFLERARMPLFYFAKTDAASAYAAWRDHFSPLDKDYDNSTELPLSGVFSSWAKQDFDAAYAEYLNLTGEEAEYALRGLINDDDPEQRDRVLELVEQSGDTEALAKARSSIVRSLARAGEHDQAVAWLEEQNLDVVSRAPLEESLANGWFYSSPADAAAWLIERSDDSNRPERMADFAQTWADWEANAAGEWLGKMVEEHGSQADLAIGKFARTIANQDPPTALDWVAAIEDDKLRQIAARRVGGQFSMRMIDGVEAILADSPLSETDKLVVLEASKKRRY